MELFVHSGASFVAIKHNPIEAIAIFSLFFRCSQSNHVPSSSLKCLPFIYQRYCISRPRHVAYFLMYGPTGLTLAITFSAFLAILSQSPLAIASGSKSGATSPTLAAPCVRYSPAFSSVTPLVGLMLSMGSADDTAFTHIGPPVTPGKSFCSGAPWRCAATSSVGVWHPGTTTMLRSAR